MSSVFSVNLERAPTHLDPSKGYSGYRKEGRGVPGRHFTFLLLQPTSLIFAGGAHPVGSSMYSMLASYMHERTDIRALEGNDIVI